MKESARKELILKLLSEEKSVSVTYLSSLLRVSGETVRRDLVELETAGLLRRIHGGAVLENMRGMEITFEDRTQKSQREKRSIGKLAATLVKDNDTLVLNSGTTMVEVAKNLVGKKHLTVLTNSLHVAVELCANKDARIFLIGGELRNPELSSFGYFTHEFLRRFKVDKAILGIGGIDVEYGVTDYHVDESLVWHTMANIAQSRIIVADYSKFGICSLNQVCPAETIDWLVTDWNTSPKQLAEYRSKGVDVLVADADE